MFNWRTIMGVFRPEFGEIAMITVIGRSGRINNKKAVKEQCGICAERTQLYLTCILVAGAEKTQTEKSPRITNFYVYIRRRCALFICRHWAWVDNHQKRTDLLLALVRLRYYVIMIIAATNCWHYWPQLVHRLSHTRPKGRITQQETLAYYYTVFFPLTPNKYMNKSRSSIYQSRATHCSNFYRFIKINCVYYTKWDNFTKKENL